jgi:hypothetical protein
MATADWNPSTASNYLTLTWNYGGDSIGTGEAIQVSLTLSVSSNVVGINNFDLIAKGKAE